MWSKTLLFYPEKPGPPGAAAAARGRIRSVEDSAFWDFYWEVSLQALEDLGKREAILEVSRLLRDTDALPGSPLRLLELGCGEGQIIGALVEAHGVRRSLEGSCGVDYSRRAIESCRRRYGRVLPGLTFIEGDFTDRCLLGSLGEFQVVLLVNALHEVFSAACSPEMGDAGLLAARERVEAALAGAVSCLAPGGYLALFDGLEPEQDGQARLHIRFRHWQARRRFELFAAQYRPFRISFRETGDPLQVELSRRDFTRYITKSIFLEKRLWDRERLESYQYFTERDFRLALARLGLEIVALRTLTVNEEKWRGEVEILTPGEDFPIEHILILARGPAA